MQKSAIISGAGGALGCAITTRFVEDGYHVSGLYHSNPPQSTDSLSTYSVNLLDEKETETLIESVFTERKEVSTLISTVGGFVLGNIESTDSAALRQQIDLNFITTYNLVRPVFLRMKKQGHGKIFLTSSRSGLNPETGTYAIAYTLSKAMLGTLAKILNQEGSGRVTTTLIAPSIIDTPANRQSMPEADFSKWVTPRQMAEIIAFYASAKGDVLKEPVIKT